ncbi:MAG: hypothetical protein ABEH60_01770 [Halonotius sp.]
MSHDTYKLTESLGGFSEGEILDVTARFGDWHTYTAELEPRSEPRATTPKVVITDDPAGFTEAEILDPTARIGDWHEYDLQFTPEDGTDAAADDRIAVTMPEFEAVSKPVSA